MPRRAPGPSARAASTALAVAVCLVALAAAPAAAQRLRPTPPLPLYLALGDSVAAGVGAGEPAAGYVPLVAAELQARSSCGVTERLPCRRLQLRNLAEGGATTTSLLARQLPAAVAELEQRNGRGGPGDDVEVITLDIGGNDVFPAVQVCAEGVTPACLASVQERLATVAANLDTTLGALRAAAGPDTDIVVMTYYNPLPGCVLADLGAFADLVLEGGGVVPEGLNDIIRAAASAHGATVADTYGALGVDDVVGGTDCLHPDASGHAIIADLVAAAVAQ